MNINDALKFFEVDNSITDEELQKQYKKLAKKYHPDSPGGSEEEFKKLQQAYALLKNRNDNTFGPSAHDNLNDLFNSIFGKNRGDFFIKKQVSITLTAKEAYYGKAIQVNGTPLTVYHSPVSIKNGKEILEIHPTLSDGDVVGSNGLVQKLEADVFNLITGYSIELTDLTDEKFTINVGANSLFENSIYVPDRGFIDQNSKKRGPLVLKIFPTPRFLTDNQIDQLKGLVNEWNSTA